MRFPTVFIAIVLSLPAFCAEPMNLTEAQKSALQHSEVFSIAELHTLIATDKIREIEGINMPKVGFDASYNWRDVHLGTVRKNPMYGKEPPPLFPGAPPMMPPQPKTIKTLIANKEVRTAKVNLTVPVYDFGYVADLVSAQRAVVEATMHERDRVRQDLCFGVATQFYRALEGAKIENVVSESISILERQLASARDLYSVGLVTHNDVLVVEVQLAERQQERLSAQREIETALATLSRLTGIKITSVSGLSDVEPQVTWHEQLEVIQAKSDNVHPVLKRIEADKVAAVADVQATRKENFPDINAFVSLNTCSDKYLLHQNWIHSGIGITVPIFDGGIVDAKLAQKRKGLDELDLRYTKAIEDIHLDIQKAFLRVDQAFHQIPIAEQSIRLAEDNLAISQDLFTEGLVTSDDVLNDEGRLAQARSNYFQAVYDFYVARSALDYASGLSAAPEDEPSRCSSSGSC
jgi:outer membrane protein TolC